MTLEEYVALRRRLFPVFEVAGQYWQVVDSVLRPLEPPLPDRSPAVDEVALGRVLKESGAPLAMWTYDFDCPDTPWWWTICDNHEYDIASTKSGVRSQVRQGLRNCQVEKADAAWLAEHGYACYIAHVGGHEDTQPESEEQFRERYSTLRDVAGFDVWKVTAEGRTIAYGTCYVVEGVVMLATWKSDPASLKLRPNNALIYEMTRHYLVDQKVRYVSNGHRNLLHPTNVMDFMLKMGYRSCYARLGVLLGGKLRLAMKLGAGPMSGMLQRMPGPVGRIGRQLVAVRQALAVSRQSRPGPVC